MLRILFTIVVLSAFVTLWNIVVAYVVISSSGDTASLLRVHRETLLAPYVEFVYAANIEVNASDLNEKLNLTARVVSFLPTERVIKIRIALLELAGGRQRDIQTERDRMNKLFPQPTGEIE